MYEKRTWTRIVVGGVPVDLLDEDVALSLIAEHARAARGWPLGVMSVNLDHIHHFGKGGRSRATPFVWARPGPETPTRGPSPEALVPGGTGASGAPSEAVRWLALLDGAPLVRHATNITGRPWPRLAGSDLIEPLLSRAEADGCTVGFLGGTTATLGRLSERLASERPHLLVRGTWAPARADLTDPVRTTELVEAVRAAHVDVLVVGLGKPRQEHWIVDHGPATGAAVLLAFGAVVDFLAGDVRRAPEPVRDHGLEWAWRLALEPRRLARRYLLDGPPALAEARRRRSALLPIDPPEDGPRA